MKIISNAPAGSPEWLAARRGKITSTRASNIICSSMPGVSTYRSALEEFSDLRRELAGESVEEEDIDDERAERMAWGIESEPVHIQKLQKATGWKITAQPAVVQDDECAWLATSMDAVVLADTRADHGIAELKAPSGFGVQKWADGNMPMPYQVQLAVQLHITRLKWGILSALIPPSVQWAPIEYDEKIETWILSELVLFWENLQKDIPPPATANERDLKAFRELAKPKAGKLVYFTPAAFGAHRDLESAKEGIKILEQREREAKLTLMQELKDAQLGVFPDGSGYSYKPQVRNEAAKPARTLEIAPILRFTKSAL